MAHLVNQWKERVDSVMQELQEVRDETSAIHRQREQLKIERNTFSTSSKAEKMKIQEEMKQLEAVAATSAEQLQTAASRRAEADSIMSAAQTEYQLDLVSLMNQVKAMEESLAQREIPAEALERESSLWCAEEESLRTRMRAIEKEIVEARRAASAALAAAEEDARHAEAELHTARMERNADEGTGPFVFEDAVVKQYPELFHRNDSNCDDTNRVRKGRSASGRPLSTSRKGSQAQQQQPLAPRRANASVVAAEDRGGEAQPSQ